MPRLRGPVATAFGLVMLAATAAITLLPARATAAGPDVCLQAPYDDVATPDGRRLAEVFAAIAAVFERLPMLEPRGHPHPVTLCLSDRLDGAVAYFDVERGRIVLERTHSIGLQMAVLLHELRHADQFRRGFCPSNRVSMKENARAVFAMEADASAVAALAAWILKDNGQPAAWDALSGWDSQTDITARFESTLRQGGDVPAALAAAFGQWYASENRLWEYYAASCSDYLDRQDQLHALPRYDRLRQGFFGDLCVLDETTRYPCRAPDAGH